MDNRERALDLRTYCGTHNCLYQFCEHRHTKETVPSLRQECEKWLSRPHSDCYFSFEQHCKEDREAMIEELAEFVGEARAAIEGEPLETIDGENQSHAMVVRNLAM